MDRERIVGTPEVIQAEPISNDSSESKLVGSRTASAICVVEKLVTVTAFHKACSVSSVEQSGFHSGRRISPTMWPAAGPRASFSAEGPL
jgi:hypothetical protein